MIPSDAGLVPHRDTDPVDAAFFHAAIIRHHGKKRLKNYAIIEAAPLKTTKKELSTHAFGTFNRTWGELLNATRQNLDRLFPALATARCTCEFRTPSAE